VLLEVGRSIEFSGNSMGPVMKDILGVHRKLRYGQVNSPGFGLREGGNDVCVNMGGSD
jgi:hypothetical protein